MTQPLTENEQRLIKEECAVLSKVMESLTEQLKRIDQRLQVEHDRSRELTSSIVAASRDEDKAMLASDEAVSHALRDNHDRGAKTLLKLLKKPYFARFVVEEEVRGKLAQREYRLGFAANPDCRIVDWRKAPISKLYYEYKEGDEFAEEIQGHDREGVITLRHAVEIKNGELVSLTTSDGTFKLINGEWVKSSGGHTTAGGHLKDILSLITPEQFQLITENAETAILLQGIAGSGKTTVALHRLAWLLHEDNSECRPEECLVLVLSDVLKRYISSLLPALNIDGVNLMSYREWTSKLVQYLHPDLCLNGAIHRNERPPAYSIVRLKNSLAFLTAFEDLVQDLTRREDPLPAYHELTLKLLSEKKSILSQDTNELLDEEMLDMALEREQQNAQHQQIDLSDEALLLRMHQIKSGHLPRVTAEGKVQETTSGLDHIVVDEVQDFSPVQLASIIESVSNTAHLTLVGDTSQQIFSHNTFPGWEKLRSRWAFKDDIARHISLTISHRSTLPIMRLADYVKGKSEVTEGRKGRTPIYFQCPDEQQGILRCIDWLKTAAQKYPSALTAVICENTAAARDAHSLLEPTFGSAIRVGSADNFTFDEGIIVAGADQVKGLEFTNVLLWNPTRSAYPDSDYGRNLLYIAITRAEENVAIVCWQSPSKHLPHIHSKVIRGYDFTSEEEATRVR